MELLTEPARRPDHGVLSLEWSPDLPAAMDIAFLGIPHGSAYRFHGIVVA